MSRRGTSRKRDLLPEDATLEQVIEYHTRRRDSLPADQRRNLGGNCACGFSDFANSHSFVCTDCNVRFHRRCVGVTGEQAEVQYRERDYRRKKGKSPEPYFCPLCAWRNADPEAAAARLDRAPTVGDGAPVAGNGAVVAGSALAAAARLGGSPTMTGATLATSVPDAAYGASSSGGAAPGGARVPQPRSNAQSVSPSAATATLATTGANDGDQRRHYVLLVLFERAPMVATAPDERPIASGSAAAAPARTRAATRAGGGGNAEIGGPSTTAAASPAGLDAPEPAQATHTHTALVVTRTSSCGRRFTIVRDQAKLHSWNNSVWEFGSFRIVRAAGSVELEAEANALSHRIESFGFHASLSLTPLDAAASSPRPSAPTRAAAAVVADAAASSSLLVDYCGPRLLAILDEQESTLGGENGMPVAARLRVCEPGERLTCDCCGSVILDVHCECTCGGLDMCVSCGADNTSSLRSPTACTVGRASGSADGGRLFCGHRDVRRVRLLDSDLVRTLKDGLRASLGGRAMVPVRTSARIRRSMRGRIGDGASVEVGGRVLEGSLPLDFLDAESAGRFAELLALRVPMVVVGLHNALACDWSMAEFLRRNGPVSMRLSARNADGETTEVHTLATLALNYLSSELAPLASPPTGERSMLKLINFPDDRRFNEAVPDAYSRDLMQAFPPAIREYLSTGGARNVASYVPDSAGPPDLGPKLYIAPGYSRLSRRFAQTNLHCDISDAWNLLVHCVDVPAPTDPDEAGDGQSGAVWDIWLPEDKLLISAYLAELAEARGLVVSACPIHDQIFYLEKAERVELSRRGIKSYRFVQRLGDLVVIPAGAPHQVRNLSSCVKVAMDFISPENIDRCFELADDFKTLRRSCEADHHFAVDKLQLPVMLFHALKSVLFTSAAVVDDE